MTDVFVSYASADGDRAQALAATLEHAGFSVWWDRHLLAGQSFQQEIQGRLAEASAVVVLWTPMSVGSQWVYSEARRGHHRGVLVQARTAGVGIDDLPAPFDALHCPDAEDTDAVLRAVAALVGRPARSTPTANPTATTPTTATTTRERKLVTVLSAELDPEDDLDPEELDELAPLVLARVHAAAAEYGGTSVTETGLAVTATFGADRAHEDDPLRAVSAALAIQEAVAGSGVAARIGIATGEALVSGATVSGTVTAAARRLRVVTGFGTVLVDETTEAVTRRSVEYDDARRAIGVRGSTGADPADPSLQMVGREDELAQLQRSLQRAARDSSVQLVTVIGEPGLGKSRLIEAFATWIGEREEPVVWRQGGCPPFGGSAYAALGELVRAHAGIRDDDSDETVRARLSEAIRRQVADTDLADQEAWLVDRLAPLVGLSAEEAGQEELFTAWARLLGTLAYDAPVVLVFEDLHWAEPALLDFLTSLLQRTSGLPILVVATARSELLDRVPDWGRGHRNATTLALAPLTGADLTELLEELAGDEPLPDELMVAVLSQSGGNPLYAREFLSLYRTRSGALDPDELPGSVRAMVAARLDTLAGHAKRILQTAAVVGHTFWTGTVATLNQEAVEQVEPELRDLTHRELLRRAHRSRIQGESEFAFAHALFADVALASLPRADRVRLFRAAAEWHAARIEHPDSSDRAPLVAHLFEQAHAAAPAEAAERDALAELAATWHGHAARHAQRLDPRVWLEHAQSAVALTASAHPARAERLHHLGWAQVELAQSATAEQTLRAAALAAQAAGDEMLEGGVLIRLSRVLEHLSRGDDAQAAIERSIALLERHGPGPTLVEAYLCLTWHSALHRRLTASLATSTRTLELAQGLDLPASTVVNALLVHGEQRLWNDDLGGLDDLARAEEAARESGQPGLLMHALRSRATAALHVESYPEAIGLYELTLGIAEETGHRTTAILVANQLADTLIRSGRLDDAGRLCRRYVDSYDDQHTPNLVADLRATWAWALVVRGDRGDLDDAAALLALALPVTRTAVSSWQVAPLLTDAERVRSAGLDAPNPAVDELAALLEGPDFDSEPEEIAQIARLLARSRSALVERLLAPSPSALPVLGYGHLAARATLAEVHGSTDEARQLYLSVAADWGRHGGVLERLYALLGAARCCLATGLPAYDHLAEVRDVATTIGARPLAAEAAQLLAAL